MTSALFQLHCNWAGLINCISKNKMPSKRGNPNPESFMKTKLTLFALMMFALAAAMRSEAGQSPQFATIYVFGGVNAIPGAGLTLGPGGKLFGTTYGGAAADGTGTIYELVPKGNGTFGFNTLYRFDTSGSPPNDGQYPYAGMALTPDGTTLYGTTQQGGTDGAGVIY